ncbi:hypothetical protein TRV_01209 [Trichophyton verrucosum HKI 0517]|uniref:CUB domain-containing protein n=1 Tax=Trichophyton verrucosum (strain HKI 0517) TaxID=663202 RepID=D4D2A6_TRIVH|nr:uncharacterized protein TRV_01209 [Trichophyton verrucosum HKI 0517]EFE44029.1 hypothetical protein TRV_01209 [Trichophyton verrucosum HKI 0517]
MRVYSDYCRTRWRLPETSYSNESEATLDYGGWEAEYAGRCLASSSSSNNSHCLWLVAVDERYSELLSAGIDISQRGHSRVNIEIPEQILSRTRRFRFDIKGCDGDTHHGYGQRAISSDEFRVSTSTRIAARDAEDDQTLTVGSKTGIGIGVGLAVIALASLGFLRLYRRRRRRREIDSYLAASRPEQPEAATSTMASPETIAEMPTDNETVKQSVFEMGGQGQQLGELQGSLAASEMPASSAHQQPAAPVELPGSIPRTT